jgi:hypothetical protein
MFVGTIHGYVKQILEDKFDFGNNKVFDENREVAYLMRVGWGAGFDRNSYSENCLEFICTISRYFLRQIQKDDLPQKLF